MWVSIKNMSFFSKFGRSLRSMGTKISHGVRTVGNKVGTFLLGATPVLVSIPDIGPEAAALSASLGGAAKGVGALGGVAENALAGKGLDLGAARAGAGAVKDAYKSIRRRGSRLERGGS